MSLLAIIVVVLLAGCERKPEAERAADKRSQSLTNQQSVTSGVIETMAQRPSIDAGMRARSTIDRVNKQRRKSFKEDLGE